MLPNFRPVAVPLVTRGAALLSLLLLCGTVLSSLADSSSDPSPLGFPSFIKALEDQTGISGGVASFVCQVTGDPKPRISWSRKGRKVSSQRLEVIEFDDGLGSVLRIQPLRSHRDEGIYQCTAANSAGHISSNATLTVLEEQETPHGFPIIIMGPQLRLVEKTRPGFMLCAASGNPEPEISWYKDMVPMNINNSTGRIKQLRSGVKGVLNIENSEESDEGRYECVATNSVGTRFSAPANLYVRVRKLPPRFLIPPMSQEVMYDGSVNLTCSAVGSPMPYVKWMMASEDLTPEDEIPMGRNVLELTHIRQSANYTCVAMSSIGMIEATAEITVKVLPKPLTSLTVTETTATSVTLAWDSGNPSPVSYTILYKATTSDGKFQKIEGVTTTHYSIGGLSPYSEYKFRVVAVNEFGHGPLSDPVVARTGKQVPSSPPLHLQAHVLSPGTMLVRWDPPEEPNGVILAYTLYYSADLTAPLSAWKKINTTSSYIFLTDLIPGTTYSLGVLGFTSVGDGPLSDIVQVKTQPRAPAQPSNFDAEAEQDDRIMLTWLWPVQDPITKYELQYWEAGSETKIHRTIEPASSYVVDGLKPDTLYHFILAAHSEGGRSIFTEPIEARTTQSMLRAPPRNLEVEMLNSTTIRVTWKPPLQQKQHGQIRGYQVIFSRLENGEPRDQPNIMDVARPEAQEAIIRGLHPDTTYSVTVAAYTTKGDGARSKAKVITTTETVPGKPRRVNITTIEDRALIHWQPPTETGGDLTGYQLQYKRTDDESFTSRELKRTSHLHIVTGLHKGATYIFRLSARNSAGIGEAYTQEISTPLEDVPSGFPNNLQVTPLTQSSLHVTWEPPLQAEQKEKIIHYLVMYGDINNQQSCTSKTVETHMTIQGLSPDTTYDIRVQAYTSKGAGPLSPSIHSKTMSQGLLSSLLSFLHDAII